MEACYIQQNILQITNDKKRGHYEENSKNNVYCINRYLVAVMIISNFSSAQKTAKLTTSSSVNAGDTFDVTFSIQPGAVSLSFSMEYDSSVFEYSGYEEQRLNKIVNARLT